MDLSAWFGHYWDQRKGLLSSTAQFILEEERKTLKSTLDVDLNLSQHLMSTSQVNISCQHLMSIFQLDFPFLMPSISQYLEFIIYNCYFWVGFPVSANPTQKYNHKCRILNIEKYLTAETGNPPQKFNHKCRISISRNT